MILACASSQQFQCMQQGLRLRGAPRTHSTWRRPATRRHAGLGHRFDRRRVQQDQVVVVAAPPPASDGISSDRNSLEYVTARLCRPAMNCIPVDRVVWIASCHSGPRAACRAARAWRRPAQRCWKAPGADRTRSTSTRSPPICAERPRASVSTIFPPPGGRRHGDDLRHGRCPATGGPQRADLFGERGQRPADDIVLDLQMAQRASAAPAGSARGRAGRRPRVPRRRCATWVRQVQHIDQ